MGVDQNQRLVKENQGAEHEKISRVHSYVGDHIKVRRLQMVGIENCGKREKGRG